MEIYNWWMNSSEDILSSPDKLKVIKMIVKSECTLREVIGLQQLTPGQINKLIALLELKYLLEQKQITEDSLQLSESIRKCKEEILKIRNGKFNYLEVCQELYQDSRETQIIESAVEEVQYSNQIIRKLMLGI